MRNPIKGNKNKKKMNEKSKKNPKIINYQITGIGVNLN